MQPKIYIRIQFNILVFILAINNVYLNEHTEKNRFHTYGYGQGGQNVYFIACYIKISEYKLLCWDLNGFNFVVGLSIVVTGVIFNFLIDQSSTHFKKQFILMRMS